MNELHHDLNEQYFYDLGVCDLNESVLIDFIEQATDMMAVYCAVLLLRKYGSIAAIPCLQKAMHYPKQAVKITALGTIASVAKEQAVELYIATLSDLNYRDKWVAICAIADYGDETAIAAVIGRVRKILAMKKRPTLQIQNRGTELKIAVTFLQKYADRPEVGQFLRDISSRVML